MFFGTTADVGSWREADIGKPYGFESHKCDLQLIRFPGD